MSFREVTGFVYDYIVGKWWMRLEIKKNFMFFLLLLFKGVGDLVKYLKIWLVEGGNLVLVVGGDG